MPNPVIPVPHWLLALSLVVTAFFSFGEDVARQAVGIAWCESRLEIDAHRSDVRRARQNPTVHRSGDYGLMQINYGVHHHVAPEGVWLFEPDANLEYAVDLYKRSGWRPWVCSPRFTRAPSEIRDMTERILVELQNPPPPPPPSSPTIIPHSIPDHIQIVIDSQSSL